MELSLQWISLRLFLMFKVNEIVALNNTRAFQTSDLMMAGESTGSGLQGQAQTTGTGP